MTTTNMTFADKDAFFARIDDLGTNNGVGSDSILDLGKACFVASREGLAAQFETEGNSEGSFANQAYRRYAETSNAKSLYAKKIAIDNADSLKAQVAKLNVFVRAGATPELSDTVIDETVATIQSGGKAVNTLGSSYGQVVEMLRKAMASKDVASFDAAATLAAKAEKAAAKVEAAKADDEERDVAALFAMAKSFIAASKASKNAEAEALFVRIGNAIVAETATAKKLKADRLGAAALIAAGVGTQTLIPANSDEAPVAAAQEGGKKASKAA